MDTIHYSWESSIIRAARSELDYDWFVTIDYLWYCVVFCPDPKWADLTCDASVDDLAVMQVQLEQDVNEIALFNSIVKFNSMHLALGRLILGPQCKRWNDLSHTWLERTRFLWFNKRKIWYLFEARLCVLVVLNRHQTRSIMSSVLY